jgi:hypothetical protein
LKELNHLLLSGRLFFFYEHQQTHDHLVSKLSRVLSIDLFLVRVFLDDTIDPCENRKKSFKTPYGVQDVSKGRIGGGSS